MDDDSPQPGDRAMLRIARYEQKKIDAAIQPLIDKLNAHGVPRSNMVALLVWHWQMSDAVMGDLTHERNAETLKKLYADVTRLRVVALRACEIAEKVLNAITPNESSEKIRDLINAQRREVFQ